MQDRESMDVDVVRAVRLWYSPAAAELAIDLKPEEGESRLGVGISCTEEVRIIQNYHFDWIILSANSRWRY